MRSPGAPLGRVCGGFRKLLSMSSYRDFLEMVKNLPQPAPACEDSGSHHHSAHG